MGPPPKARDEEGAGILGHLQPFLRGRRGHTSSPSLAQTGTAFTATSTLPFQRPSGSEPP